MITTSFTRFSFHFLKQLNLTFIARKKTRWLPLWLPHKMSKRNLALEIWSIGIFFEHVWPCQWERIEEMHIRIYVQVKYAHNIIVECHVCDERINGGNYNHFENGVLLQKIQDIMLIIITKKITNFLLNWYKGNEWCFITTKVGCNFLA